MSTTAPVIGTPQRVPASATPVSLEPAARAERTVEQRLAQAEEQQRIALAAAELGTWRHDIASDMLWHDERARFHCGLDREWVPAAELFARIHPEDAPQFRAAMATALDPVRSCGQVVDEFRIIHPGGAARWLRVHAHVEFAGDGAARRPLRAIGTTEDITARMRVREQLARLSKAYETLSEINKCVARAGSEEELLAAACRAAVEHSGFRLVRVVPLDDDAAQWFAGAGLRAHAAGLADNLQADWPLAADARRGLRAALERYGQHCSAALAEDRWLAPWAPACRESGIAAVGIFPLRGGGRVVGAMIFHAAQPDCFDADMIRLLAETAADVSFGLGRLAQARRARDTELRFTAIFRSSPVCILITRMADGCVVDANDAFLRTFGHAPAEAIGRTTADLDLWADAEEREAMGRVLDAQGRVKDFEAVWRRRAGEPRDCLVSAEIITLDGARHLSCMVTDITERRAVDRLLHAREQEFRALAEHSPDIIVRYGRDCRRLYANPAMARAYGLPLDDILGKSPIESRPDNAAAAQVQEAVARVLASAAESELEIETNEGPGGQRVFRHIRLVPEFDADGRVASVLAIGRDVTRLKEAKRRLRDIQEQLRELEVRRESAREDERKRMARDIHDVLGQLLTALRLDIDMLGMEFGAEQPALLERTAKTMQLADETIAFVRNLASALRPPVLDMGIVSALEWQAKEFAGRSGVACEVAVQEGEIDLDEAQSINVFRLVQESLTNVARHARAGHVGIDLAKTPGGYRLLVRDDGVGFTPALASNTSLGLAGMRERAVVLGGELVVDSAPGRGTEIEVWFPPRHLGAAR